MISVQSDYILLSLPTCVEEEGKNVLFIMENDEIYSEFCLNVIRGGSGKVIRFRFT